MNTQYRLFGQVQICKKSDISFQYKRNAGSINEKLCNHSNGNTYPKYMWLTNHGISIYLLLWNNEINHHEMQLTPYLYVYKMKHIKLMPSIIFGWLNKTKCFRVQPSLCEISVHIVTQNYLNTNTYFLLWQGGNRNWLWSTSSFSNWNRLSNCKWGTNYHQLSC